MRLIRLVLVFLFLSLTLGQFGRVPFFSGNFNFYLQDLAVLAFAAAGFSYLTVKGGLGRMRIDAISLSGSLFVGWSLITFVYNSGWLSSGQNLLGFSYWLRFLLYFSLYFILTQLFPSSEKLRKLTISLMILAGLLIAAAGFIQLLILPDLAVLAAAGYDPHRNRLVSTFLDPNFTGAFLVLSLNLVLSRFSFRSVRSLSLVSALLVALVLTFSRSAWLMLTFSLLGFGLFKSRKLLLAAVIIGFLAYFLVPRVQTRIAGITDPDDSAKLRLVSWERAATIAKDHLLLGVGFNNFRAAQEDYGFFDYNIPEGGRAGAGSDSSLLLVLATTGIFGLALYLVFLGTIFRKAVLGLLGGDPVALALLVSLVGLLFESNFINSLFFTPILLWLFTAASLLSRQGG